MLFFFSFVGIYSIWRRNHQWNCICVETAIKPHAPDLWGIFIVQTTDGCVNNTVICLKTSTPNRGVLIHRVQFSQVKKKCALPFSLGWCPPNGNRRWHFDLKKKTNRVENNKIFIQFNWSHFCNRNANIKEQKKCQSIDKNGKALTTHTNNEPYFIANNFPKSANSWAI